MFDLAVADQPIPQGAGRPIVGMVISDLCARDKVGRERYGESLKANNGRDALVDAYQETLDLCMYLRQELAEREVRFDDSRRWRFDFAWPADLLALEVEGGTASGNSRHSRGKGFERDCEKYNTAALQGWRVLRVTSAMVRDGRAVIVLSQALRDRLDQLDINGRGDAARWQQNP